jgi:hypothetical protein
VISAVGSAVAARDGGALLLGWAPQCMQAGICRLCRLRAAHGGHWFSTQGVSEANGIPLRSTGATSGSSGGGGSGVFTWRIAAVDAVKRAGCVNGAMVHEIHSRNASCFAGCAGGVHNTTSNCYIRCLFDGLLGSEVSGAPPLGGNLNATGKRLLSAFERSFADEAEGGCPELPANETVNQTAADAWSGPAGSPTAVVGVKQMRLYTLTHANGSMLNGNAADSAGAAALLLLLLRKQSSVATAVGVPHVSETVTQVDAEINTLFGEFTACATATATELALLGLNHNDIDITCAPTWDCQCVPFQGDPSPPHCETLDEGQPCECALWGGCAGGNARRRNNAGVLTLQLVGAR